MAGSSIAWLGAPRRLTWALTGVCARVGLAGIVLTSVLSGCSGVSDPNTDTIRKQLTGDLSFAIGMSDYWYSGTPQWCTSGTTSWGAYQGEGDFESDQQALTPLRGPVLFGAGGGSFLSEDDRVKTITYLAMTLLKGHFARRIPGYGQWCYDFDAGATASLHATYRHGATSRFSHWAGDPSHEESPNWDIVVPIGKIEVDDVSVINEFKMNTGIEYTCRSYRVDVSYHGVIKPLDGKKYQAQATFCLDPQDNNWKPQQFKWT